MTIYVDVNSFGEMKMSSSPFSRMKFLSLLSSVSSLMLRCVEFA